MPECRMLIRLLPPAVLESVMARRSEWLPATLLSRSFVTLKVAGTKRSSRSSSRGRKLSSRRDVDLANVRQFFGDFAQFMSASPSVKMSGNRWHGAIVDQE